MGAPITPGVSRLPSRTHPERNESLDLHVEVVERFSRAAEVDSVLDDLVLGDANELEIHPTFSRATDGAAAVGSYRCTTPTKGLVPEGRHHLRVMAVDRHACDVHALHAAALTPILAAGSRAPIGGRTRRIEARAGVPIRR